MWICGRIWLNRVWLLDLLRECLCLKTPSNLPKSPCAPPSISYKYPWTIGAAYPTTVPHSQSDTAGSPAHLDPACQSHSTYPALRHGVPPGRALGGLGRQHPCWGARAAGSRSDPGKTHPGGPSWRVRPGRQLPCNDEQLCWKIQESQQESHSSLKAQQNVLLLTWSSGIKLVCTSSHSLMNLYSKASCFHVCFQFHSLM